MTKTLATYALPQRSGLMDAEIVLRHLPHNTVTPYVTHQHNLKDDSYYWGHYFSDELEARADFLNRCKGR